MVARRRGRAHHMTGGKKKCRVCANEVTSERVECKRTNLWARSGPEPPCVNRAGLWEVRTHILMNLYRPCSFSKILKNFVSTLYSLTVITQQNSVRE